MPACRSLTWTWPVFQLITADDREVGSGPGCAFQLLAQAPRGEVRPAGQAGTAQLRCQLQPDDGVPGVGPDDHDGWLPRLGCHCCCPTFLERQRHPVQADAEADAWRGLAAQQLHEAVISTAATEGLLLAFGAGTVELEGRARVVVEPADQAGRQPRLDGQRLEMRQQSFEVRRGTPRRDGR